MILGWRVANSFTRLPAYIKWFHLVGIVLCPAQCLIVCYIFGCQNMTIIYLSFESVDVLVFWYIFRSEHPADSDKVIAQGHTALFFQNECRLLYNRTRCYFKQRVLRESGKDYCSIITGIDYSLLFMFMSLSVILIKQIPLHQKSGYEEPRQESTLLAFLTDTLNCASSCKKVSSNHPVYAGRCLPFIHYVVSNDSVGGQWSTWSDCASAQSGLVFYCPHMTRRQGFAWWG